MPVTTDFDTFAAEYLSRPIRTGCKDIEEPSMFRVIENMNEELAQVQRELDRAKECLEIKNNLYKEAVSKIVFHRDFMREWREYVGEDRDADEDLLNFRRRCKGKEEIEWNNWDEHLEFNDMDAAIDIVAYFTPQCSLGKDWLLRQVCVEGAPNNWNFSIYTAEEMWVEEVEPLLRDTFQGNPFDRNEFVKDFFKIVRGDMCERIFNACSGKFKDLCRMLAEFPCSVAVSQDDNKILKQIFIDNDYSFIKDQQIAKSCGVADNLARYNYKQFMELDYSGRGGAPDNIVYHTNWGDKAGGFVVVRQDPSEFEE